MVNGSDRSAAPEDGAAGSSTEQKNPSSRSLSGLDGLNFLMAEVVSLVMV